MTSILVGKHAENGPLVGYWMADDYSGYLSKLTFTEGSQTVKFDIPFSWFQEEAKPRTVSIAKLLLPEIPKVHGVSPTTESIPRSMAATESIRKTYTGQIDWNDNNSMVSRYFTVGEVTNHDSRRIPTSGSDEETNIRKLAQELDKLREAWGHPIGVTSWYRPYDINLAVGGVPNSTHISGGAADIYDMSGNDSAFELYLDQHWGGGVGYGVASGRGFTHVDLFGGGNYGGPGGFDTGAFSVRWNY
jgi:putative chitinase